MTTKNNVAEQALNLSTIADVEKQLGDVMEITNTTEVKEKLQAVEKCFSQNPNEINKLRLGIIYHETALNLSFLSKTEYKGYAQKSFDCLSELFVSPSTTKRLLPFIAAYRASALSLVCAEAKKMKLLTEAFVLFADAIDKYADISGLPEFLRGSVAENLPWFFVSKRKMAKNDFGAIISKQEKDAGYANWKTMSFTYWAWANQHRAKKYRNQAIDYLNKAILLDPDFKAGKRKAEELKLKWAK